MKIRQKIEDDFITAMQYAGDLKENIESRINMLDDETALYMKYLYAYMPLSDMADYSFDVFLSYAQHAKKLHDNPLFNMQIPDEYFFEYILAHRINSEDITDCREFFYNLVVNRIKELKPEEAVLELNNWCYEQATYRSTSARTASPITVYKGGFGRCGEESTFLVTILRSVGLPARQIYVPRWSHSDSNHAWVEVWIDGKWMFTGACEPKPIMNNGWFSYAASRAMLVHSRLFGNLIYGNEEISQRDGNVSELNMTSSYALSRKVTVNVLNPDGKPSVDCIVRFEIINSAEFYPIAILRTDENGNACIRLGRGNVYITAYSNGLVSREIVNVAEKENFKLKLSKNIEKDKWQEIRLTPPDSAKVNEAELTKELDILQNEKNKIGDIIRQTRQDGYQDKEYKDKFKEYPKIVEVLTQAKGNFNEIMKYLDCDYESIGYKEKEQLLDTISQKDCRDISAEILLDHSSAFSFKGTYDEDIFKNYILSPRIFIEKLSPFRKYLEDKFKSQKDKFVNNPEEIWKYICDNITYIDDKEYTTIMCTPCGIFNTMNGTPDSKKILFVAICRTFGIPARIDWCFTTPQYYKNGKFINVEKEYVPCSTLILHQNSDKEPQYEQNFTIGRSTNDGGYETLGLWDEHFKDKKFERQLPTGDYRLILCSREQSGTVIGKMIYFSLSEGEKKELTVETTTPDMKDIIVEHDLNDMTFNLSDGDKILSEISSSGKNIFIFTEPGKEPTEHIFNEILEINKNTGFPTCGLFIGVKDKKECNDETFMKIISAFSDTEVFVDDFDVKLKGLEGITGTDSTKLPFVFVTDKKLHSIYSCSGYRVGTGDVLAHLCN